MTSLISTTDVALTTAAVIMSDDRLAVGVNFNAAALVVENLYSGVAVDLGTMLINDTLFIDLNETSLLGNKSDLVSNRTANATNTEDDYTELLKMAVTSLVLGLMILVTIIGNVFVIAAIILERNLQNVANYLVASLAVADLFVACLVMPLGAVYEISQGWILGPELCDIWTSCDVLCCTASILHLVAIAVDRYWAVTNIDYIHSRTSRRVFLMIFCVWSASVIVSLAPQFGWKDPDYLQRIEQQKCMVSQDIAYQVFATCCTFYVPLLVILVLYWKIYQTARKRIHRRRPRPANPSSNYNQSEASTQKKRKRLKLRFGKFSAEKAHTATSLGLVDGNSTNTINTVEDTEFSSSNMDSKSRAGIEVTTHFGNTEEIATTSVSQISTVSHLVALANQQMATSTEAAKSASHLQMHQEDAVAFNASYVNSLETPNDPPTAITLAPSMSLETKAHIYESSVPTSSASNGNVDVLQDPHLQQLLEQQVDSTIIGVNKRNVTGGTSTSNATTITSISAMSPQTPTPPPVMQANTILQTSHAHNLPPSINESRQVTPISKHKGQQDHSIPNPMHKVTKRKETLEAKRERKAAKTLAIITGAFVICWLPFFAMALLLPLCTSCEINDSIASLFLWLGYFNSTLNPVIYTIFSPEFRQAFKRILFGGHRPVRYRSGKI